MARTNWDFSQHEHRTEIFTSPVGKTIRVDEFQKGNSRHGYIKFVNDLAGGMSVYGDFGNWIFYRNFIPHYKGAVSDRYWIEKLEISSCQKPLSFDSEGTEEELQALIDGGFEEYGYEGERLVVAKEWASELIEESGEEFDYTIRAFRGDNPLEWDYENIPFVKKPSSQLLVIFDAFEEMCRRMPAE